MLRKISFSVLLIISILLASATVAGKIYGENTAYESVYGARWTICLWTALAILSSATLIRGHRALGNGAMLLHMSLLVVLAGAGVTHFFSKEGSLHITVDRDSSGKTATATTTTSSGKDWQLPFSVALKECIVEYYPATETPSSYSAELHIGTPDGKETDRTVAVNKVLTIEGCRIYLAGISDNSCTLKISNDAIGTGISYAGYVLFAISGLLYLFNRRKGYRAFVRGAMAAACCLTAFSASAAEPMPKTPQKAAAENFGRLRVYYRGRVTQVSALAKDFCTAVTGHSGYRGLTPEQVLMGWIFNYEEWKNEPMIKIKGDALKNAFHTGENHVSLVDFYRGGRFVPDGIPMGTDDKNVTAAADRADFISRIATGKDLLIFPIGYTDRESGESVLRWVSWTDDLPQELDMEQWKTVRNSAAEMARLLASGKNIAADGITQEIARFQDKAMKRAGINDSTLLAVERLYIKYGNTIAALLISAAGIVAFLILSVCRVRNRKTWLRAVSLTVGSVSALYILLMLIARGYIGGYFPMSNGFETMLAIAFAASLLCAVMAWNKTGLSLFAMLTSLMALSVAAMSENSVVTGHIVPVLDSPWLTVHVMSVMISYALFATMAFAGGAALASGKERRNEISRFNRQMLFPAVYLLGIGIFLGAVWANQSWGRYWGWDAKETWALITFFVYSFPLHKRGFHISQRNFNLYLLCAFPVVLVTYFGVNFLLGGLHSYAG